MAELEQALVALGRELDFPPAPDLSAAVRARIDRRARTRRWLVLALAVVVVGIGIAMAVPDARSAILRFFHIGSVKVERVDTLPRSREAPLTAGLGTPRTRAEAEQIAGFRMILPRFKGAPPKRYFAVRDALIATVIRSGSTPVLLTELKGEQTWLSKKVTDPQTKIEGVRVGSHDGLFLSGGRHVLMYQVSPGEVGHLYTRFAGNVLIWAAGDRTFRLEGNVSRNEAIRLARLIRG
ncbi:MAG: hypothetical protein E6G60_20285 [Actinobacteria bacterium]|nr:MAG: hypothetical protein E6G60_20285 [Actinomycetota bacterium]